MYNFKVNIPITYNFSNKFKLSVGFDLVSILKKMCETKIYYTPQCLWKYVIRDNCTKYFNLSLQKLLQTDTVVYYGRFYIKSCRSYIFWKHKNNSIN
jgi:hypothetical protein